MKRADTLRAMRALGRAAMSRFPYQAFNDAVRAADLLSARVIIESWAIRRHSAALKKRRGRKS